ncbi:hypothetical protein BJ742DRAFT_822963 [Cladochytrium replicatum]|nr:hypothetical protein BJ742DRAFT_822963 [Cladochytrium replicatum]
MPTAPALPLSHDIWPPDPPEAIINLKSTLRTQELAAQQNIPLPPCPVLCNINSLASSFQPNTSHYSMFVFGPSGVPVLATNNCSQEGIFRSFFQVEAIAAATRQPVLDSLHDSHFRVSIFAQNELISDMPENYDGPGDAAGLFMSIASRTRDVAVALINERSSLFSDGGTTFHEFGHATDLIGQQRLNSTFLPNLLDIYNRSIAVRWKDDYARTKVEEFWAEGSRIYFGCGVPRYAGEPGAKSTLATYDPDFYNLLSTVYNRDPGNWTYSCRTDDTPICDRNAAPRNFGSFSCPATATIQMTAFTSPSVAPTPSSSRNGTSNNGGTTYNSPAVSNTTIFILIGVGVGFLLLVAAVAAIVSYVRRRRNRRAVEAEEHRQLAYAIQVSQLPESHYLPQAPQMAFVGSSTLTSPSLSPSALPPIPAPAVGWFSGLSHGPPTISELIRVITSNGAKTNTLRSDETVPYATVSEGTVLTLTPRIGHVSVRSTYPLTRLRLFASNDSLSSASVQTTASLTPAIPPLINPSEVYYYEVRVLLKPPSTELHLGLVDMYSHEPHNTPGLSQHTLGWSSSGTLFASPENIQTSPVGGFTTGDVVGLGFVPATNETFFTKNGEWGGILSGVVEPRGDTERADLFAAVGCDAVGEDGECLVHVNFGESAFAFERLGGGRGNGSVLEEERGLLGSSAAR